ncbi:unnamed protein product [Auanema sp. JU1783]|nr:unnamed protein product [Auanema sp. JU1783]
MIDCFKIVCLLFVSFNCCHASLFGIGSSDDASFQSYEQLQKILEEGNKRSQEIEKFTKEHTIRHNQRTAAIASASNVMTPIMSSTGFTDAQNSDTAFLNQKIQIDPANEALLPTLLPSIESSGLLTTVTPKPKIVASVASTSQENEEFLDKMRVQSQIVHNAMMSNGPSFLPQQGQVLILRDASSLVPGAMVPPPPPPELAMNPLFIAQALPPPYSGLPPFLEPQRTRIAARPGRFDDELRPRPQLPSRESRELL